MLCLDADQETRQEIEEMSGNKVRPEIPRCCGNCNEQNVFTSLKRNFKRTHTYTKLVISPANLQEIVSVGCSSYSHICQVTILSSSGDVQNKLWHL